MSLLDGSPNIATEYQCAHWGGDGKSFRCYLCGHRFVPGGIWRAITGEHERILVCKSCDTEDVLAVWKQRKIDAEKFWWFIEQAALSL